MSIQAIKAPKPRLNCSFIGVGIFCSIKGGGGIIPKVGMDINYSWSYPSIFGINSYKTTSICFESTTTKLSNTLDNPFIQKDIPVDNFSPVLASGPYGAALYKNGFGAMNKTVGLRTLVKALWWSCLHSQRAAPRNCRRCMGRCYVISQVWKDRKKARGEK